MSYWDHNNLLDAKFAVWAEEDFQAGIDHCRKMIGIHQLEPGSTVVDFGCGIGRLLIPYAKSFPGSRFIGIDTSPAMAMHAMNAAKEERTPNVELFGRWPSGGDWCDFAYSVVVVQHLTRYQLRCALSDARTALRSGAPFRLQFVQDGEEAEYNHPIALEEFTALASECGFTIGRLQSDPLFPTWTWVNLI